MKSVTVITTYPHKILVVAVFFILATLYGYFVEGSADITGLVIGVLVPFIAYLFLEKKVVTFNKVTGVVSIYSKFPLKETTTNIKINQITNMEVVKGRGHTGGGGAWFIKVSTKDGTYPITSFGSLSKKSLDREILNLQQYL